MDHLPHQMAPLFSIKASEVFMQSRNRSFLAELFLAANLAFNLDLRSRKMSWNLRFMKCCHRFIFREQRLLSKSTTITA